MSPFFDQANAWVAQQLGSGSGPLSVLPLLVGGMLASLLPCVYPLYPITASILRARSSSHGPYAHPLAYYVGLVVVYGSFGVVASTTGGAFNDVLRWPVSNLLIGMVMLLLAFATAGSLHFPALQPGRDDGDHDGLWSTFVMGASAGLLSSACVGPIVVGILVSLAAGTEQVTASATGWAALKLGVFGMGVGLPLLLIGVFGVSLPRSGAWMVWVQGIFALLIGYFALGYFAKGIEGYGFSESAVFGILAGGGLVLTGSYFRQDEDKPPRERIRASLATLCLTAGFFVLLSTALSGSSSSSQRPSGSSRPQRDPTEEVGNLTWYLDRDRAYETAARAGKSVFIDFYGNWCSNCKAFQKRAQNDPRLNAALRNAVLLKVYDTSPLFAEYRDDPRFPELRVGLPFFVITDVKGDVVYKTSDFTKTEEMILFLE